jgi:hypothetical protein
MKINGKKKRGMKKKNLHTKRAFHFLFRVFHLEFADIRNHIRKIRVISTVIKEEKGIPWKKIFLQLSRETTMSKGHTFEFHEISIPKQAIATVHNRGVLK